MSGRGSEMACACTKRKKAQFLWYKGEVDKPVVYNSEIEAKAKVLRLRNKTGDGGRYIPYDKNVPVGTQIAVAEAARVAG